MAPIDVDTCPILSDHNTLFVFVQLTPAHVHPIFTNHTNISTQRLQVAHAYGANKAAKQFALADEAGNDGLGGMHDITFIPAPPLK